MKDYQLWLQARKDLRQYMSQQNKLLSLEHSLTELKLAKSFITQFPNTLGNPILQGRGLPINTNNSIILNICICWEFFDSNKKNKCLWDNQIIKI